MKVVTGVFSIISILLFVQPPCVAAPSPYTGISNVVFKGESSGDWVAHEYMDELVSDWNHDLFLARLDPTIRVLYEPAQIQILFQQYKLLGALKQLEWPSASGRESTVGMIWNCTANADFENNAVELFIRLKETPTGNWYILSFSIFERIIDSSEQVESYAECNLDDLAKEYEQINQNAAEFSVSSIRDKSAFLLYYADRLITTSQTSDAAGVLRTYLTGRPDDLERQFQLAELMSADNLSESTMRYRHVASRSEDFDLVRSSLTALGENVELKVATNTLQACSFENVDLVFFPMKDVDALLYEEVAKYIKDHSGLNIAFLSEPIAIPEPVQDLRSWYIETVFMSFMANTPKEGYPLICIQLGWEPETNLEILSVKEKERFLRDSFMILNNGNLMLKRFEHELESMQQGSVYGSTDITQYLRMKFPFRNKNALAYIGFTDRMVSLPDRKDCFGFSDGVYGIVSSFHFMATRTGEQEDRQRLVSRLGKQALSTIASTLGVRRCVSPGCPKAFPRSVQARDGIEPRYCDACQAVIDDALRQRKLMFSESLKIANEYTRQGNFEKANEWQKISLESASDKGTRFEALLMGGNILTEKGKIEAAFHEYLKLIRQYPENEKAVNSVRYILRRLANDSTHSIEEKLGFYDTALSLVPDNLDFMAGKALFLCNIGNVDESMQIIEGTKGRGVVHPGMTVAEMVCWQKRGNREQEAVCMGILLQIKPDDLYMRFHYAKLLQGLRRFEESETQYRSLLQHDPRNVEGLHQFAILLSTMGKFEEAVEIGKRELSCAPKSIEAHSSLGYTHYRMGNSGKAIELYDKAIVLWEGGAKGPAGRSFAAVGANGQKMSAGNIIALTYYNKALAHVKLNQIPLALSAYQSAVSHGYPKQQGFEQMLAESERP